MTTVIVMLVSSTSGSGGGGGVIFVRKFICSMILLGVGDAYRVPTACLPYTLRARYAKLQAKEEDMACVVVDDATAYGDSGRW